MSLFSTNSCLQYCIRATRNTTGDQVLKLPFGHCGRLISGFPHQILQQTSSSQTVVVADQQVLQVRVGYVSRLISRSSSAGLPYDILGESPSTPVADGVFPLPLRELEDPLLCEAYVVELLSWFNLERVTCNVMARKITSLVGEIMGEGNYDVKFQVVADIEYIEMFWAEERRSSEKVMGVGRGHGVIMEERVVLAPRDIERKDLKECSICCDHILNDVAKIPCGHVYHKSCILTWFDISNSCPLCRTKIKQQT